MTYYDYITSGEQKKYRRPAFDGRDIAAEFSAEFLPPEERMTRRFEALCANEEAHIFDGQKIVFMRTSSDFPDVFTPDEWTEIKKTHFIHELGYTSNVTPDYKRVISRGFCEILADERTNEYEKREINALMSVVEKYRAEAERIGRDDVYEVLSRVPWEAPRTFREALQFFRIVHYALWLEGTYHVTCGRFDKYMYPYYKADVDAGRLTDEEALDLVTDFFLSFNIDSDLYPGVQQGDNGQSMVLGGCDADGNDWFTRLSEICLLASGKNKLIDPKINMRVSKSTPADRFVKGSRLTAVGMGFPQYSNDDVVIPGLEKLGYAHEDAAEYGVAACWEFIVPGNGFDVANIAALSFPKVVDNVLHRDFASCKTKEELTTAVKKEIAAQCANITSSVKNLWFVPAPFLTLFFDAPHGDVSRGSKYNNFGAHGTGISTAADSLAAMVKYVLEDKTVTAEELTEAVDSDFEKHSELLPILRNEAPKMGSENGEEADKWAVLLLRTFAEEMSEYRNCRGGCWRAGTGSAMYYLWHASEIGASPDGRRKGEPFGTNYSPSLFAKTPGPVSIIRSFTKPELVNNVNGGPLTLEFDSSVFSEADAPEKLGALVRYFIALGGHQLQLNSVSKDVLLDAQAHPEKYSRLIVRIWGWSAYFTELDKPYQDHVIARQEYKL